MKVGAGDRVISRRTLLAGAGMGTVAAIGASLMFVQGVTAGSTGLPSGATSIPQSKPTTPPGRGTGTIGVNLLINSSFESDSFGSAVTGWTVTR